MHIFKSFNFSSASTPYMFQVSSIQPFCLIGNYSIHKDPCKKQSPVKMDFHFLCFVWLTENHWELRRQEDGYYIRPTSWKEDDGVCWWHQHAHNQWMGRSGTVWVCSEQLIMFSSGLSRFFTMLHSDLVYREQWNFLCLQHFTKFVISFIGDEWTIFCKLSCYIMFVMSFVGDQWNHPTDDGGQGFLQSGEAWRVHQYRGHSDACRYDPPRRGEERHSLPTQEAFQHLQLHPPLQQLHWQDLQNHRQWIFHPSKNILISWWIWIKDEKCLYLARFDQIDYGVDHLSPSKCLICFCWELL